jgi:hypothetical protein
MNKNTIQIIFITLVSIVLFSCSKEAGEGGSSAIRGRVYAKYYNDNFTLLNGEGWAPEEDVYIIYGDGTAYNDKVQTSYDGSFEFRYLQKGHYKIFVYSKDSTLTNPAGKYPVFREVNVTSNNTTYQVPDITIFD